MFVCLRKRETSSKVCEKGPERAAKELEEVCVCVCVCARACVIKGEKRERERERRPHTHTHTHTQKANSENKGVAFARRLFASSRPFVITPAITLPPVCLLRRSAHISTERPRLF